MNNNNCIISTLLEQYRITVKLNRVLLFQHCLTKVIYQMITYKVIWEPDIEISISEFIKAHRKIHQIQITIINNKWP
jgi:hypothetical protein